jgi:hypothetical protein
MVRMSEARCLVKKKDSNWVDGEQTAGTGIRHPAFVPVSIPSSEGDGFM